MSTPKPSIVFSSLDVQRIEALLERMPPAEAARYADLASELARAEVVAPADMPPGVVTMNSTVRFEDEADGDIDTVTLVYPAQAGQPGTVSILAPVGSALLGLTVGQHIEWPMPDGRHRRLRVLAIDYQPEASGDLHR
ncbi:nucleoside diphosphate kinase regulator [Dyella sp.]|uniref:nucleoside diphosphate kinase regulator n=1 Tax=Dyella sp. TaxID=1869338 RepID=UPI002ED257CB